MEVKKTDRRAWIKEITVYPYLVTEATVFNLPTRPQVRLVTEYLTNTDSGVVFGAALPNPTFATVVNRDELLATTDTATTTYQENPEYQAVSFLLATTSPEIKSSGDTATKTESTTTIEAAELSTTTLTETELSTCLLYTSPSPRDRTRSRMPSSA